MRSNAEYRDANPHCELLRWFPKEGRRRVLYRPVTRQRVYAPLIESATEIHHICGSTNGAKRVDEVVNIVHLCRVVHDWVDEHKKPAFVLSCWTKFVKGELDWQRLSDIIGWQLPSRLECDDFVEQCGEFPWVEEKRRRLCQT